MNLNRILYCLSLVFLLLPVSAQNSASLMSVLLDSTSNNLIMIDAEGNQSFIDLMQPDNAYIGGIFMTVSDDGQYAAICAKLSIESNTFDLFVLNLDTNERLNLISYEGIARCDATSFSPDGQRLAVSVVNIDYSTQESTWSLDIFDLETGAVAQQLNQFDQLAYEEGISVYADVLRFESNDIIFAAMPFVSMDSINQASMYTWSLDDDRLEVSQMTVNLSGDTFFGAGEVVFPYLNETMNAAMPVGPLPQANEIHISDARSERVIYRNTDWVIVQTKFVADGQYVAALLLEGEQSVTPVEKPQNQKMILIGRDGQVIEFPQTYDSYMQFGNHPDGVMVLDTDNPTTEMNFPLSSLTLLSPDGTYTELALIQSQGKTFVFPELVWYRPLPDTIYYPPFASIE